MPDAVGCSSLTLSNTLRRVGAHLTRPQWIASHVDGGVCDLSGAKQKKHSIAMRMRLAPIVIHHPAVRELVVGRASSSRRRTLLLQRHLRGLHDGPYPRSSRLPQQRAYTALLHTANRLEQPRRRAQGSTAAPRDDLEVERWKGLVEEKVEVTDGNAH